ncbi:hypothetical protein L228DRAFT_12590 [Xylona heveae TC161]|uniref:Uncharacterized protein n=1 Tax=Xylona heveae (strain CBS 132557 / TC161) TaxID=1328760 RepID=A0A165JN78_XYLHT|nr:hypothetical protein L228DRAFT_12590 [Xylona heveae TC161]KZF26443.1 hypothetical protein L228DRAFT_12590 [Xylona heveae TC161]
MEPWQSWTIVLLGGGAAWWYYQNQNAAKGKQARAQLASEQSQPKTTKRREENKAKRRKDVGNENTDFGGSDIAEAPSATSSGTEGAKKKNRKASKKNKPSGLSSEVKVPAVQSAEEPDTADDVVSNKEFAKQLAGLKAGTTLSPAAHGGNQRLSAASSTAGADADDDLSPAVSPAVRAGDVSDMLEAPAAGPSVLRLTESTQPARAKPTKSQRAAEPVESKKQRQNRRKNEELKQMREETEKQRRELMEKQRRTAREAEGRPAKNGLGPAQSTNAWNTKSTANVPPVVVSDAPLLDTFEHDDGASTSTNEGASNNTSVTTNSNVWEREVPSEEEQMRMINEIEKESGWNTVAKGRKGKKGPGQAGEQTTGNESSDVEKPATAKISASTTPSVKTPNPEVADIQTSSAAPSQAFFPTWKPNPLDSDWAVA